MASTTFACAARGGLATGTSRRSGTAVLPASSSARSVVAPAVLRQSRRRSGAVAVYARGQPLMPPRTPELGGDPFSMLLDQRVIFLGGEVNDFVADAIISQLLLLDAKDAKKDIKLFINSPGGSVTAGLGIYDAMQMTRADVSTYCFGLAASMGAFLLCAGATGKRHAMPNARIMIHQPLGGASGQAVDIEIQAKEIMFHKANLNRIMASRTGKSARQIDLDTDRDRYMSALEAKRYGLIDHVIGGDDAGFKITGDLSKLPKTKEEYVAWGKEAAMGDDGSRAQRFKGTVEPFVKPLNPEGQK